MKGPPPVRVALGSSRMAAASVLVAYLATAALLAFAPGPPLPRAVAVVPIAAHAVWTLRRWALRTTRTAVIGVELSADGRAALIERGGRRWDGCVQPESYVGAWLTTFVIRPHGTRTSRSTAILPDMLAAEDLRQLRVLLRVAGSAARHR